MGLADPRTKTVLLVDDDETFLNLLEVLVRRDGFKILLASDGDKAMEQLKAKPDALVLDMMLPGRVSGADILDFLQKGPEPPPPVVVVSAYGHLEAIKRAVKGPAVVSFLAKPVKQDLLLATLHEMLKTANPRPPKPPEPKP